MNKITTGKLENIGNGDPLRQSKNMLIIFAVLCSSAAIDGGVSPEGSLNLSNYFIQTSEAATSISEIESIEIEMYLAYINRVKSARKNSCYSPLVQACAEYVQTNIFMRISLNDISSFIGYTEHYVSHVFKKEMGISLSNYINQQKIEMAKDLLKIIYHFYFRIILTAWIYIPKLLLFHFQEIHPNESNRVSSSIKIICNMPPEIQDLA